MLRKQRGLSVAEVARLAGVSEDRIKALEAGRVTGPYLDTLTEYAHALGKTDPRSTRMIGAPGHAGLCLGSWRSGITIIQNQVSTGALNRSLPFIS